MAAPINHIPKGTFTDEEIDGLCDWYDQALASGQGFRSEEERKKYFDDLGDPLEHPLFAGSTEDLEGNELVEAFRCIREEDKTNVELAVMYKEEGNEWMKNKKKKDLKEAIIRYTHALTFLDTDDAEKEKNARVVEIDNDEDSKNEVSSNDILRSQILNNRALASMHLKNYGTALGDINMCLLSLSTKRKSELALNAAKAGLDIDNNNKDILKLLAQCEKAVAAEAKKRQEAEMRQRQLEAKWTEAWNISKKRGVRFGLPDPSWHRPPQLLNPLPFYSEVKKDDGSGVEIRDQWPLVVLYPQHRQIDVVQGVDPSTMLAMLLAEMFPEPEDGGIAVNWDTEREYHVSNLSVYIHLNSSPIIKSVEEWIELQNRLSQTSSSNGDSDDDFDKFSARALKHDLSGSISLCEVHLGCTFDRILRAPHHILDGGLLSLIVFPKANTSPSDVYMKKFGGRDKCGILNPV